MNIYDLPRIVSVQKKNGVNAFVVLEFNAFRDFIMKIMFDDEIDEEHYLQENPDVRKAVESGAIPSGNYHFKGIGYVEGRKFRWKSASDDVAEKTDPAPASKQPLTAEKANPIKGADAPPAIEKAPPPTGPAQSPGTEKPPTKGPSAPPPKTPGPFFPSR